MIIPLYNPPTRMPQCPDCIPDDWFHTGHDRPQNRPYKACIVCNRSPAERGCRQYDQDTRLSHCASLYCSRQCRKEDSQFHTAQLCAENENSTQYAAFRDGYTGNARRAIEFTTDGKIRFVWVEINKSGDEMGKDYNTPFLERFFPKDPTKYGSQTSVYICKNERTGRTLKKPLQIHYRAGFMNDKSESNNAVQGLKGRPGTQNTIPRWKGPLIVMKKLPTEYEPNAGYADMELRDLRDLVEYLMRAYWDTKEGERPGTEAWKPQVKNASYYSSFLPSFLIPGSFPQAREEVVKKLGAGVRISCDRSVYPYVGEDLCMHSQPRFEALPPPLLPVDIHSVYNSCCISAQPVIPKMLGYALEVLKLEGSDDAHQKNSKLMDLYYEIPGNSHSKQMPSIISGNVAVHRTDGKGLSVEEITLLCCYCHDLASRFQEIEAEPSGSLSAQEVKARRAEVEKCITPECFAAFCRGYRLSKKEVGFAGFMDTWD